MIEINEKDLAHILLCAFRYSLGRMSYITSVCAAWLVRYWHIMPPAWQKQIHEDIEKAIKQNCAGMDCDIASWKKVLELPLKDEAA